MQELEHWNTKFSVAAQATEGFFSKRWVARNLFDLSEEEFLRNQRELYYDKHFSQSIEMLGQEAMAPGPAGGAGMGDMGGGMEALGGEEMAPEGEEMAPAGEEGAEAPPEEADTSLLAAPGKRDEDVWIKGIVKKDAFGRPKQSKTSKSKGKWYSPVTADQRQRGARKRNMRAKDADEFARQPSRQLRMGLPDGASELLGLGKGINEEQETIYNDEERKLFEVNQNIKTLIEAMEQKDNVATQ